MKDSQQVALRLLRDKASEKGTARQREELFKKVPTGRADDNRDLTVVDAIHLEHFFGNVKGCSTIAEEATLLRKWIEGLVP